MIDFEPIRGPAIDTSVAVAFKYQRSDRRGDLAATSLPVIGLTLGSRAAMIDHIRQRFPRRFASG